MGLIDDSKFYDEPFIMNDTDYDIFLISPVRKETPEEHEKIKSYVLEAERYGLKVYWPKRDNPYQNTDKIGNQILEYNLQAIKNSKAIHIWYQKGSTGSIGDICMALALNLNRKITVINPSMIEKTDGKSFENVLLYWNNCPEKKKKIYVCAPLNGETKEKIRENIKYAYSYARKLALQGHYPLIPHTCAEYLNDQSQFERLLGQTISKQMIIEADEMHIIPDKNNKERITDEMRQDIKCAEANNIKIITIKTIDHYSYI